MAAGAAFRRFEGGIVFCGYLGKMLSEMRAVVENDPGAPRVRIVAEFRVTIGKTAELSRVAGLAFGVRHEFQIRCPVFMLDMAGCAADILFDNPLNGKHGLLYPRRYREWLAVGPRCSFPAHLGHFLAWQAMRPGGVLANDMAGQAGLAVFTRAHVGEHRMHPAERATCHRGMTIRTGGKRAVTFGHGARHEERATVQPDDHGQETNCRDGRQPYPYRPPRALAAPRGTGWNRFAACAVRQRTGVAFPARNQRTGASPPVAILPGLAFECCLAIPLPVGTDPARIAQRGPPANPFLVGPLIIAVSETEFLNNPHHGAPDENA